MRMFQFIRLVRVMILACLLGLLSDLVDGRRMILRNVGKRALVCTWSHSRIQYTLNIPTSSIGVPFFDFVALLN